MTSCATELGHESCGFTSFELEHEGHKSSSNSWERSRNKVYQRKVARQQGRLSGPVVTGFKKGKR